MNREEKLAALEALDAMIEKTSVEDVLVDLHSLVVARAAVWKDHSSPRSGQVERDDDQVRAYQIYLYWDQVGQYLETTKTMIEHDTASFTKKLGGLAFRVKSG